MAPFQGLGFASNAGVEASTALTPLVHGVPLAWSKAQGTWSVLGAHSWGAAAERSDVGSVWGWDTWPPACCTPLSRGLGTAVGAQKQGLQHEARAGKKGRRAAGGCPQAQDLPSATSGPRTRAHAGAWHWARHGISVPLTACCWGAAGGRMCCHTAARPRRQPEAGTAQPPHKPPPVCPQPPCTEPELCETPVSEHNNSHSQDLRHSPTPLTAPAL